MKRALLLLLAPCVIAACVANRAALERSLVQARSAQSLELGMSKAEVLSTMGQPDFQDRELTDSGDALERLRWLTNYDHHIYTVVTIRSGSVTAITEEEGPAP